jgi:hypothetical protein
MSDRDPCAEPEQERGEHRKTDADQETTLS